MDTNLKEGIMFNIKDVWSMMVDELEAIQTARNSGFPKALDIELDIFRKLKSAKNLEELEGVEPLGSYTKNIKDFYLVFMKTSTQKDGEV